jgi:hypothetical protein
MKLYLFFLICTASMYRDYLAAAGWRSRNSSAEGSETPKIEGKDRRPADMHGLAMLSDNAAHPNEAYRLIKPDDMLDSEPPNSATLASTAGVYGGMDGGEGGDGGGNEEVDGGEVKGDGWGRDEGPDTGQDPAVATSTASVGAAEAKVARAAGGRASPAGPRSQLLSAAEKTCGGVASRCAAPPASTAGGAASSHSAPALRLAAVRRAAAVRDRAAAAARRLGATLPPPPPPGNASPLRAARGDGPAARPGSASARPDDSSLATEKERARERNQPHSPPSAAVAAAAAGLRWHRHSSDGQPPHGKSAAAAAAAAAAHRWDATAAAAAAADSAASTTTTTAPAPNAAGQAGIVGAERPLARLVAVRRAAAEQGRLLARVGACAPGGGGGSEGR